MKNKKFENLDAEQDVLAGLLKDVGYIDRALLTINSEYFTKPLYKRLFDIITQTYSKHGSLVTVSHVSNLLESWGMEQEARIKVLDKIEELKEKPVNKAEFVYALRAVKSTALSRSVSDLLVKVTNVLDKSGGQKAFTILDKKLYDLKLNNVESNNMEIVEAGKVDDLILYLKDVRDHPEKYRGIPSGWKTLDSLTGGFHPAEYILVIAKSGSGKSMSLINWANHASKNGYNCVYVSMEMPHHIIRLRQLALESGIQFMNLKLQTLSAEELNKQDFVLRNEIGTRTGRLHIIDVPKCTVGLIEAQLRQLQQNMHIDIVFIDYLSLLKPEAHVKSRAGWEIASEISNNLRELARTLKIPVVSAMQVNAGGMEKGADDDLELEDIAISKRIADPADLVVGVIWDKTKDVNKMKLCVPKCRNGRITSADLWCDLNVCKIADMPIEKLGFQDNVIEASKAIDKELGDLET